MATSAPTGDYSFASLPMQTWTIQPFMEPDTSACVTHNDAALTLEAAVGNNSLGDQELLAADVSGDGKVTSYDAALMMRFSAGMMQMLPVASNCGTNWLFVPDATEMPNQTTFMPVVSESNCTPGSIELDSVAGPIGNRNFRAVLIGDVDGSWIAD